MSSENSAADFKYSLHAKYFLRCLFVLPSDLSSLDDSRVALAFYSLAGLDLLDELSSSTKVDKSEFISWIYQLQWKFEQGPYGFRGSTSAIISRTEPNPYDRMHVTMTMTSLLSLLILGDDLEHVEREKIASSLRYLQLNNGAFLASPISTQNDLRFVYCACAIAFILNDWSGIDRALCEKYILSCRTYEFAFGQVPDAEAHGGSTFCAVASLSLLDVLDRLENQEELIRWCLFRQEEGFNGRPNKPEDSCYSWWIVATLKLLKKDFLIDCPSNETFLHATESKLVGGFSKWPDSRPDPLHSYLSLAGLSLMKNERLKSIHPALIVSSEMIDRLREVFHKKWMN